MKSPTSSTPLHPAGKTIWIAGQWIALLTTVLILIGLVQWPDQTLTIAWFAIVPILPASFLINPGLWRNVCPIATANMFKAPLQGRKVSGGTLSGMLVIGMVLLLVLVPARRLILNTSGPVLAGTLVAIVLLAFVLGRIFRTKGGFCNTLCPVLPVEKLYGQSPLVWVRNSRCVPCSGCAVKGCLDLDPAASVSAKGEKGAGRKWIVTPMGLFAAMFPGFVFGYFQTVDASLGDWMSIYSTILIPAGFSLLVAGGLVFVTNLHGRTAGPILGAVAVGIYYWFAGPSSAEAFGLGAGVGLGLRWGFLLLVAIWLVRALTRK